MLPLTSCSNKDVIKHNYKLKDESELWKVYYLEKSVETFTEKDGKLDYDCDTEVTFTAVYKNGLPALAQVKKIEIGYDTGLSKSVLSEEYDEEGPYSNAFVIRSNCGLVANEDGIIKASISIDGDTETFELKNQ